MTSEVIEQLMSEFRQWFKGECGSPGTVRNLEVVEEPKIKGLKLRWDPPENLEEPEIRYKAYLLCIKYDMELRDMVIKWRQVYHDEQTEALITSDMLDVAAVYVDPEDTAYHFVVFGLNCCGDGRSEYIKHPTT